MNKLVRTILIVDDAPEDRVFFRRLLTKSGPAFRFRECDTGAAALEICRQEKPDCILLDFDLPDMTGAEILHELELEFGFNIIPVVVVSGNQMIENAVASLERGAQDFLVKGRVVMADLVRAIENAIEKVALFQKQKQVEEALKNSEERYRGLFNSIDEGFCVIEMLFDETGQPVNYRFLVTNPAFEKQSGIVAPVGKTALEITPKLASEWFEVYGKVALTGESIRFTREVVHTQRWFDIYAFKAGDPSGKQVAVLFTDITERKIAEKNIKESETRLKLATEVGSMYAFEWNPVTGEIYREKNCAGILGLTAEQAANDTTENWLAKIHPADRERFVTLTASLRAGLEAYKIVYRMLRPDNSIVWLEESGRAYFDEEGTFSKLIGITLDITGQVFREEELRAKEEFNRTVLESSQDCVKVLNPAGQLQYMNANGMCLMEIDDFADFHNQSLENLWNPKYRQQLRAAMDTARAGAPGRFQGLSPTAKGKLKWWDVLVSPVCDATGEIVRLLAISRDITEIKGVEEEREALYAREKILRSEAESANHAKDEFLAVLSHELRSPLNSMYGWVRMLQNGSLSHENTTHAISVIERNVRLQMTLIEDLLDVSRIITGKMKLEAHEIAFNPVLEAALETARPAAGLKNIRIEKQFLVPACDVYGDSFRLQQIVGNLLTNAIKFTPEGGCIIVGLSLLRSDVVRLTVQDTGCGIAQELLPDVFDRFKQADASTKRKYGGLGLGLAIVRSLVEMHQGQVSVESDGEGQGATFTVDLPLLRPVTLAAETKNNELPPETADNDTDKLLAGLKIVIVDDQQDSLELLAFVLEYEGAEVESFTSPADALQQIVAAPPDLLISDIGMAEMDGLDFIRQVRNLNNGTRAYSFPAIALTGFAGSEDRDRAYAAGFQLHLQKPVDVTKLPMTVKNLAARPA